MESLGAVFLLENGPLERIDKDAPRANFGRLLIQGPDELLLGGVLRGNIMLVQGAPGTGKQRWG